jgi:hypothetical protein
MNWEMVSGVSPDLLLYNKQGLFFFALMFSISRNL